MPPGSAVWDDGCSKTQGRKNFNRKPRKASRCVPFLPTSLMACQWQSSQVRLACRLTSFHAPHCWTQQKSQLRVLKQDALYLRQTPRLQTAGPGVGLGGKQMLSTFPSFCHMGVTEPSPIPYPGNYRVTSPAPSQDTWHEFMLGSAPFPSSRSWCTGALSSMSLLHEIRCKSHGRSLSNNWNLLFYFFCMLSSWPARQGKAYA